MSIASTIAVSGLSVASLRLQVAASNIANASSDGPLPGTPNPENFPPAYSALRVNQVDNFGGETSATVTNVLPSTIATYDRTAPYADGRGMVASPNVDLANELVQALLARFSYAANAQVISVDAQMSGALFNIAA
ncbi:MAG TPA: flagellar basal body rod C-terminal domain-containing protein [Pseudolabrys sp.]|jgi:flagellar basal-body rod protein FlgC|nr:flagellar basal body rod C-terminal domain-containing protein [Pseudolabrys sp.]